MEICKRNRLAMRIVADELDNIANVCKELFETEKWNCPINHGFGIVSSKG